MPPTTLTLNTGAPVPFLGFGTWQAAPGEVRKAVAHAIKSGYRHIDCASCYGNEDEVGEGIKEAIDAGYVSREALFVTTKVWCTFSSRIEKSLDISLRSLKLDYVDLFLVHWPVAMNSTGRLGKLQYRVYQSGLQASLSLDANSI